MKAFFIRQILPPVLFQLSIIVVLVYFEAKDFVAAARYSLRTPKPRPKTAMLLIVWLAAYPVFAAMVLLWQIFLQLLH